MYKLYSIRCMNGIFGNNIVSAIWNVYILFGNEMNKQLKCTQRNFKSARNIKMLWKELPVKTLQLQLFILTLSIFRTIWFFATKSQRENRFKEAAMFWKKFQVKTLQYFFHFEPLFILEFSLCLHDFFRRNHSMKIDYSRHASLKMHQNTCYKKI